MTSPSSMHETVLEASALGQPRGMGWGRWGGDLGCGTHVHMADSCQCMAKTTSIV